jgi:hypothetical protein
MISASDGFRPLFSGSQFVEIHILLLETRFESTETGLIR